MRHREGKRAFAHRVETEPRFRAETFAIDLPEIQPLQMEVDFVVAVDRTDAHDPQMRVRQQLRRCKGDTAFIDEVVRADEVEPVIASLRQTEFACRKR